MVVAGFQGQSTEGAITTLGRGGSDLTTIALAARLRRTIARSLPMWTASTPAIRASSPDSSKIDEIAYDELLEMAGAGSKECNRAQSSLRKNLELASKFGPA